MKLQLISLSGFFLFAALAWVFSTSRRKINWRTIAGGLLLQLLL
jgi:nucleoside permease NupC